VIGGRGWSPIVELRQYTLHAGRRDVLIDLFDSEFIESQEDVGMKVIGQFRDLDDPDKFVWLRGFHDMPSRARGLAEFYGGPVWHAHREAANATMIDSDDVLLLRPARAGSAFMLDHDRPRRAVPGGRGFVGATIVSLEAPAEETGIVSFFEQAIMPAVIESGGSILAYFVSEASENTFPSLPVRQGEQVLVWFAGYADGERLRHASTGDSAALRAASEAPGLRQAPQVLRLEPTTRSLLHVRSPACGSAALDPQSSNGKET